MARGWRGEAKRYGAPLAFLLAVTVAVLLVRSGLQSDPGTTLSTPTITVPTTSTSTRPVPVRRRRFYKLRSGETLSDVAIKFNTSVSQLLALNPGIKPTNLTVGQRVRVK
ncbi:MAG: LysM domain [Gaiellaceae bacterium]|nr:LysM domain [Gaiellaceae bacterium]